MTISKKTRIAFLAYILMAGSLSAQETEFDFATQRSESQNVQKVLGQKIDHKGIIINPTPQQFQLLSNNKLNIMEGIVLKDHQKKFANDINFLKHVNKGIRFNIDFGTKIAAKNKVKNVSGAYGLRIDEKGINIVGYDERGAFYGIQTLKQLLSSPACSDGRLPYLIIYDYPDLPNRGVVEGFYGTPWSHKVRLSLIDLYGKFKMNTYLYGPKDDPFHSSPNWRKQYPENEAANIKDLVQQCNRNRVDFVWAIHPGKDIKWNEADYKNLLNKFNMMYDLGVRHYAIFFDDISGEGTNPLRQTELLNRLTKEFVDKKKDVSPLTVCPTDYSKLWANPNPEGSLAIYGNTLNPAIKVFWTGDYVCSDLTPETLEFINSRIKRPAYFWWNFPVTDYVRHILLQGPVYGLDTNLTDKQVAGIVSNPMEHGEASKLALYGVADYAWNIKAYNAMDNWERGLKEMMPEAPDAYRTFAIHSCDTETGYRRAESWETITFSLSNWNDKAAKELETEFVKIENTPSEIARKSNNIQLVKELTPWLTEFAKLGTRGKRAIELGRIYRSGKEDATFWNKYVQNIMSRKDRELYNAHKSGTMKLQPFYENMMDDMSFGFFKKISGETAKDYRGITSFSKKPSVLTKLMLDNDNNTFYTTGEGQKPDSWIGLDLREVRDVKEVSILQGRNSTDDSDYFDNAVLEASADGNSWTPLLNVRNQYVINWKGKSVQARYVRLRRLDSKRKNWASIRSFEVNPVRVNELDFDVKTNKPSEASAAFDSNLNTFFSNNSPLSIGIPTNTRSYTILCGNVVKPVIIKQHDKDGKLLSEKSYSNGYVKMNLVPKAAKMEIVGDVDIYEIIANK